MSYQEITAQQAKQMMEQESTILIDVREPAEHANKHIPESRLHPVGSISEADIPEKQHPLIIYCQKGMRGKKACEKLSQENPELKIFNVIGGIEAWEVAGLATQSKGGKVLPLDRQVQLAIGVMVLVFSLLAMFVSSGFVWATVLIGLSLCLAGLTGFCVMAKVVAVMPWNQRV